jgi:glycosyltransferase involved in cell wall biosynthesis
MLAKSTPANIEVICAVNGDMDSIVRRLENIAIPLNLTFVPTKRQVLYPANALRNVALSNATAEWLFYLDCDFVFCERFWGSLSSIYSELVNSQERICLCPVSLWDPLGAYLTVSRSADLIDVETMNSHRPPRNWAEARKAKLFKNHKRYFKEALDLGSSSYYEITDKMKLFRDTFHPAEPWGLLRRRDAALADEDFAGGPMDKQQFVSALLDRGVRFFALTRIFIFHLWHPYHNRSADRARNMNLWSRRYHSLRHRYVLLGIGDVLPPHLEVSLRAYLSDFDGSSNPLGTSDAPPEYSSSNDKRQFCDADENWLRSMANKESVVTGPPYLSRAILEHGYRVCVFFHSPSFYREGTCGSTSSDSDSHYVEHVTHTSDFAEAIARIENTSILCNVASPSSCIRAFQNLLGIPIPPAWFSEWKPPLYRQSPDAECTSRLKYPTDYLLYDYMRVLAGRE